MELTVVQASNRLCGAGGEDGSMDGENAGGALGPADIKEELFDNVNVHYRQPAVRVAYI